MALQDTNRSAICRNNRRANQRATERPRHPPTQTDTIAWIAAFAASGMCGQAVMNWAKSGGILGAFPALSVVRPEARGGRANPHIS